MKDSADIYRSVFTPTLNSSDGFVTASFMFNEGTVDANVYPPSTPIAPELDATLPLRWIVGFGSDGFGFDAGNSIAFDNIKIEQIPEPNSLLLSLVSSIAIALTRRRLQSES